MGALLCFSTATTLAFAQVVAANVAAPAAPFTISLGKAFTFLFLALGPLKILGPFASMTRGRNAEFQRRLAFQGILFAAIAAFFAATIGALILERWGVSLGALELTTGIVLSLVALRPILELYAPRSSQSAAPAADASNASPASALALSPLAFPTIVTPYGVTVLIMLVSLRAGDVAFDALILGLTALVLVMDLAAMLYAQRTLSTPIVAAVLGIVGVVMTVLQIALGVQAAVTGLRLLNLVAAPASG